MELPEKNEILTTTTETATLGFLAFVSSLLLGFKVRMEAKQAPTCEYLARFSPIISSHPFVQLGFIGPTKSSLKALLRRQISKRRRWIIFQTFFLISYFIFSSKRVKYLNLQSSLKSSLNQKYISWFFLIDLFFMIVL